MKEATIFAIDVITRFKTRIRAAIAVIVSALAGTVIVVGLAQNSAQMPTATEDPCRFVRIDKWKGTFSVEGSMRGVSQGFTYTISESITGTFSVTATVSPFGCQFSVWRGQYTADVSINDQFVTADGGSTTHKGSGQITGNFDPDPTPIGNIGAKLEIDPSQQIYNFDVDTRFPVKLTIVTPDNKTTTTDEIFLWGPYHLGFNLSSIPLPATGIRLNGRNEFDDSLAAFPAHWVVAWTTNCDPEKTLAVPRLLQNVSPWKADKLFQTQETIGAKGCALTALAMVLNYPSPPNGLAYDPGSLNLLLKFQNGGFNGANLLFDTATRLATAGARNFHELTNGSANDIDDALCQGFPVIVKVETPHGQHYVVVTGKTGSTFLINDPGFGKTTLDAYPTFKARGYVTAPVQISVPGPQLATRAAQVNNSSLVIGADNNVEVLVVDPAGKRTGFDPAKGTTIQEIPSSAYFSDSLVNVETGEPPDETGHQLQIDTPIDGIYQLVVTARQVGPYTIVIDPFSSDGGLQTPLTIQGTAQPGSRAIQFQYNSAPGSSSTIGTQSCAWISPLSIPFTPAGGTGTIDVSAAAGCPWTATSNTNWITIDSGSSGSGNGTVNYRVSPATISRTGAISVANQSYSVTQAGTATPATLQFSLSNFNVAESGASATITVTRTGDVSDSATVDYSTQDSSALQRSDYSLTVGTLTFAPGEARKDFNVLVADDLYFTGDKLVNLVLSNPTKATLGNPSTATVTILDNDNSAASRNPLDDTDARFFVQQHYFDFLSRLPDPGGFDYWAGQITQCGASQTCINNKHIDVSNAFFYELEYQQTAGYVLRLYRAAFGNDQPFPNPDSSNLIEAKKIPGYSAFSSDRARLIGSANLAQDQFSLASLFVARPEFLSRYPASSSLSQFVDALLSTIKNDSGADLMSQRTALIALGTRAAVMYRLADDNAQGNSINNRALIDAEYNRSFVASQYFGYLRRDSDIGGFLFWLGQVNRFPIRNVGVQHAMVCSFITSAEYQQRFSPVVTHSNQECPQ